MPQLTRGPLPAGVYWRRRLFVLALAGTLVFVIANLLGGGSDGADDDVPVAQQAGHVEPSRTVTVSEQPKGRKARRQRQQVAPEQGPTYDPGVLVEPDGNCDAADVKVTPEVAGGELGRPVTIGLELQTLEAEACYFRVGSDKVTVRINDGSTELWTSRECPAAVPDESVVVRRVVATVVEMTWDARESDAECSKRREWLRRPGDFTIAAAALGGEPSETTFELTRPTPETVTVPPDPKQDRDARDDRRGDRDSRDSGDDRRGSDDRNDWRSEDAGGAGGDDQPTR